MNKTKVEFITSLLSDKKLSASHKERLYPLILSEIRQTGDVDEHIWSEIQEIKKIIQKDNSLEMSQSDDNNRHEPLKTSEILKLFKTGNKLKWITHIFPNSETEEFNYDKVTANAIEEYNSIASDLPLNLRGIIGLFLKPKKSDPNQSTFSYLGDKYETWWSEEIKQWCFQNIGLHPDTNEILSRTIITPFKKSIEVRTGEDFIMATKHRLTKRYGAVFLKKINLDFTEVRKSTRFFTGVDQLMSGIACLFSPILKRIDISNSVRVSTTISEVNERYVTLVTISHIGSNVEDEFNHGSISSIISGDLLIAKDRFLSLCDWNIIANFSNGTFCIPILGDATKDTKFNERVEGFTHQLIFY